MTSGWDSSSEATESNEEAIAKEVEDAAMDSFEDDLDLEEEAPLVDRKKRTRTSTLVVAPVKREAPRLPPSAPVPFYSQGPAPLYSQRTRYTWVLNYYVAAQNQNPAPLQWPEAPPQPFLGSWPSQSGPMPFHDSGKYFARRKRKSTYESIRCIRATSGVKPNRVWVLEGGEVDATCEGKNVWYEALRNFVPNILDLSVVQWEKQSAHSVKKLRDALEAEFEYVGNPLSMVGFRTLVTKWCKSERSCLKTCCVNGAEEGPTHVNPDQWDRLIEYWNTNAQIEKSLKMLPAQQSVKNYALVGRKGKVAGDSQASEGRQTSLQSQTLLMLGVQEKEGVLESFRIQVACDLPWSHSGVTTEL